MEIEFIAGFSPIVRDAAVAERFYRDDLGLRLEGGDGAYVFTETLGGAKHFGLWPLSEAAKACFGTSNWPHELPVPQAALEFEVRDVASAAEEMSERGHTLLHGAKREPWGQTIARLLSPEGLLVALCFTPEFHEAGRDGEPEEPEIDDLEPPGIGSEGEARSPTGLE